MYKLLFSILRVSMFALFFSPIADSCTPALAQTLTPPSSQLNLNPPSLSVGPRSLTPQQIQAVQNLTSAQLQQYQAKIQPTLTKLRNDAATYQQSAVPSILSSPLTFSNASRTPLVITPTTAMPGAISDLTGSISFSPNGTCPVWGCICPPYICGGISIYQDQDGLPDTLETQVANNFTPLYAVSAGERD